MVSFQPASLCRRRFKTVSVSLIRNITRTSSSLLGGPQELRSWKQGPTLIASTQQHLLATISKQCEIKAFADELLTLGQKLLTQLPCAESYSASPLRSRFGPVDGRRRKPSTQTCQPCRLGFGQWRKISSVRPSWRRPLIRLTASKAEQDSSLARASTSKRPVSRTFTGGSLIR